MLVTKRNVKELLAHVGARRLDADVAQERGLITATKVSGLWVLATSDADLESSRKLVAAKCDELVGEWFIAGMSWLRNTASSRLRGAKVSGAVAQLFIREFVKEGRFGALGLLTAEFQPYLALFAWDASAEVRERVEFMASQIAREGRLASSDFPSPSFTPTNDAWRSHLLHHGEFLGLGVARGVSLLSWRELG